MQLASQRNGGADRLHSGRAGSPVAAPAGPLVRGGGRDTGLAAMAAGGMWLGSADEGSSPSSPSLAVELGGLVPAILLIACYGCLLAGSALS